MCKKDWEPVETTLTTPKESKKVKEIHKHQTGQTTSREGPIANAQ